MWIQIEFNPDLALRDISEYHKWNKKIEECIPENLEVGKIYSFLKKDQRVYRLLGELPLIQTQWWGILSKPKANVIILEITHFMENKELWTRWKYKVTEILSN